MCIANSQDKEMNMFNQYIQYQNRFSAEQNQSSSRKASDSEEPKKIVTVYDSLRLLPFDKCLADEYQLCGPSIKNVCIFNAQVAMKRGYKKIAECWKIVANCCKESKSTSKLPTRLDKKTQNKHENSDEFSMNAKGKQNVDLFRSWTRHPDGEKLLNEIILKNTNKDFQTAAMICSVFAKATNRNVHIDGGAFFSAFVDEAPRRTNTTFSQSMEAIVKRNKEIIHAESNPKAAAIAARQLRKAQRYKGLRNLSECQSESQDRRSIKEFHKESDSVASDGDNQVFGYAGTKHQGIGDRIASSVANTNLLNIPGMLLNFTSKSPVRKPSRSISVMGLNRSFSELNVAEDIEKNISLDEEESENGGNTESQNNREHPLLDPSNSHIYDQFRTIYAEMLHKCNLSEKAVEIMHLIENQSFLDTDSFIMYKPSTTYLCQNCHTQDLQGINSSNVCKRCSQQPTKPKCVYCRLPVKGHVSVCLSCGHGGHLSHMMEWFQNNHSCAASCGCDCLSEMEEFNLTPFGGSPYTSKI